MKVFTGPGRELVGSQLPSRSSIQERVHELTVIFAEAGLIADVVEFTCTVKRTEAVSGGPTITPKRGTSVGLNSPLSESLR